MDNDFNSIKPVESVHTVANLSRVGEKEEKRKKKEKQKHRHVDNNEIEEQTIDDFELDEKFDNDTNQIDFCA